jgi:hypothetical protein
MSWRDRLGNRRGDDEDYDAVEAELRNAARPAPSVYCPVCQLPCAPDKVAKCKHNVDWNERGGR